MPPKDKILWIIIIPMALLISIIYAIGMSFRDIWRDIFLNKNATPHKRK